MPLYEYECERGHRFERIVKFSDPPIDACPECGAPARKLMSSPAIQFKGSGWYITDYARSGQDKDKDAKDAKDTKDAKDAGEGKETNEKKEGTESKETKETKETKDTKETKSEKTATSETSSPKPSTSPSSSKSPKTD